MVPISRRPEFVAGAKVLLPSCEGGYDKNRVEKSENWEKGIHQNLVRTEMSHLAKTEI